MDRIGRIRSQEQDQDPIQDKNQENDTCCLFGAKAMNPYHGMPHFITLTNQIPRLFRCCLKRLR